MQIQEILIIKNAHESYGVSTEDISQISRVPKLMPLPLRPSGVRGLCAVSGNIITMVDMNLLLGLPEVDYEKKDSRIVVLNDSLASSTLLVSEVYNTVEVDQAKIEYIEKKDDPVVAIYKYKDTLVQIISLETLFKRIDKVSIESKEVLSGKVNVSVDKEEDSARYLIFKMGIEEYSVSIDFLREIILADTEFTDIAGSTEEVLGLITLREELLLVVDLRIHYGFAQKNGEKNRILITSHQGKKIGLLVDEIVDIKNFALKNIERMDDDFKDNKIAGIIHDENNKLISYFDSKVLENLFSQNEAFIDSQDDVKISNNEENEKITFEVIIFKLAGKEYSFNIESVAEIIDAVKATSIAFTKSEIGGIINIRGQIIAIISLYEKLGIKENNINNSKIIICNINGVKVGFTVDSVSDILEIKEDEIRDQEDTMFSKILYLNNGERLVLSMDIDEIVSKKESV